jgi:RNA recognition motif-containing protein
VDRLGAAISRRRAALKYRERHHAKLSKGIDRAGAEPVDKSVAGDVDERRDAISTLLSQTVATDYEEPHIDYEETASNSGVSATSYAPSLWESSEKITVPNIPKEASYGKPFECPYCFFIVTISNRRSWARHVFKDLMPYTCVFPDCSTPNQLYDSRRDWFLHLRTKHVLSAEPTHSEDCPLGCGATIPTLLLERHIGRHLEELALFALPRVETGDGGASGGAQEAVSETPGDNAPSDDASGYDDDETSSAAEEETVFDCEALTEPYPGASGTGAFSATLRYGRISLHNKILLRRAGMEEIFLARISALVTGSDPFEKRTLRIENYDHTAPKQFLLLFTHYEKHTGRRPPGLFKEIRVGDTTLNHMLAGDLIDYDDNELSKTDAKPHGADDDDDDGTIGEELWKKWMEWDAAVLQLDNEKVTPSCLERMKHLVAEGRRYGLLGPTRLQRLCRRVADIERWLETARLHRRDPVPRNSWPGDLRDLFEEGRRLRIEFPEMAELEKYRNLWLMDLKPQSITVDENDRHWQISDFGSASEDRQDNEQHSRQGVTKGFEAPQIRPFEKMISDGGVAPSFEDNPNERVSRLTGNKIEGYKTLKEPITNFFEDPPTIDTDERTAHTSPDMSPPSSPNTPFPDYERPVRPLPKRTIKSRLSQKAAEAIEYPPNVTNTEVKFAEPPTESDGNDSTSIVEGRPDTSIDDQIPSRDSGLGDDSRVEYPLFVGNLGSEVGDALLFALFKSRFKSCTSAGIRIDPRSGASRGYGFVSFSDQGDQQRALKEMQGVYCGNQPIHVADTIRERRGADGNLIPVEQRITRPTPTGLSVLKDDASIPPVERSLGGTREAMVADLEDHSQKQSSEAVAAFATEWPFLCREESCLVHYVGFKSAVDLEKHQKLYHSSQGEDAGTFDPLPDTKNDTSLWPCPYCPEHFSSGSDMRSHIRTKHLHEKPFSCTVCGRAFRRDYDRRKHENEAHTDERHPTILRQLLVLLTALRRLENAGGVSDPQELTTHSTQLKIIENFWETDRFNTSKYTSEERWEIELNLAECSRLGQELFDVAQRKKAASTTSLDPDHLSTSSRTN